MLKPNSSKAKAGPHGSGPLQLREDELAEFAQSSEAQHLARLEGDKQLVLELMLNGYTGPAWRAFSHALVEYGLQVMRAWIATGRVFRECKSKGRGIQAGRAPIDDDEVLSLAGAVVAVALNAFRDSVLVPGKWDPGKGASLRTFFVGQCVLRFPNEYRRWKPQFEKVPVPILADGSGEYPVQRPARAPAVVALRQVWASMHDRSDVRKMLAMIEMGYSHEEVAQLLGVTKRSVDSKVYRASRGDRS